MKENRVIGIGTEVIKLVNDVYEFFDRRPEIGYVPLALGIDSTEKEHLAIELVTFGEDKRHDEERPVLYAALEKDVERNKEKILKGLKKYDCDILLIANIGGGAGSVVLRKLSRWLKELGRNFCIICIIPSPRVPTYRPILTDNAIPTYRELKGMLGDEIKSIIYMDKDVFDDYTVFDDVFRNLLIDLLLINRQSGLFSKLDGEYTVGWKRIKFRYKLYSRDFEILEAEGWEKVEKGLEISDIRVLAKQECISRTMLCPYLLLSKDTKRRLEKRGFTIFVGDVFSNRHGIEVENIIHCDWIYHNSMEFVALFKGLDGYRPLARIMERNAEYQKMKEVEVELKFEYDKKAIESLKLSTKLNMIKVGILKQEDLYFEVGKANELRLRSDESGCRITFKSRTDKHPLIRHEIEIVIGSLEDFKRLFEGLGYNIKGIVKKEREEFLVSHDGEEYILSLDTVAGIGRFIEMRKNVSEGLEEETMAKMRELANIIGLSKEVKEPYLKLKITGK